MVGLRGTAVIPPGWEAHHRPVVDTTMTGRCELVGPSVAGEYPTFEDTPGPVYGADIPCRIQELNLQHRAPSTGTETDTRQYQVTIPLQDWPRGLMVTDGGPLVRLTGYADGHAGDPDLIGRRLLVTNLQRGTLSWERVLTCVDDLSEASP